MRKPTACNILTAASVILAGSVASPAYAEVFAVLGPDGRYADTRVAPAGDAGTMTWTPSGLAEGWWLVLNPEGDRSGDEAPALAHHPATGLPFVAWASPSHRGDRDLRVATFDGRDWIELEPLRTKGTRDDREPAIAIVNGQPFVAWTRDGKTPSVWGATLGTDGRWSQPVRISPGNVASRAPALLVTGAHIVVASQQVGKVDPGGLPSIRFDLLPIGGGSGDQPGTDASDGPMPTPGGRWSIPCPECPPPNGFKN